MSSSSSRTSKSETVRRTDCNNETIRMTYERFRPGVGHDTPTEELRRRVLGAPPDHLQRATLEMSHTQQFVEREMLRDPTSSISTPRFPESTSADAAAATNFTFGAQRGASQGHSMFYASQPDDIVYPGELRSGIGQKQVRDRAETCGDSSHAVTELCGNSSRAVNWHHMEAKRLVRHPVNWSQYKINYLHFNQNLHRR